MASHEPILTPQASTRTLLIPVAEVTEPVQAPKQTEFACESSQQANVVEVELN